VGHKWYKTLIAFFFDIGYSQSDIDHSIFYHKTTCSYVIVTVATDDMAIARTLNSIDNFKTKIGQHFDISDMGELSWFLGFEVKCDHAHRIISINQRSYIQAMTDKLNLSNAKPM
jgi:hypothetical protein